MRITILLIGLCYFSVSCFSQIIIKGIIRDSTSQEKIGYASITIEDKVGKIHQFTTSDSNGLFEIPFKQDTNNYLLIIRYLSYREKKIKINKQTHFDIRISAAQFVLEEVLVKAKSPPIIVRNDTTEFNVTNFIDSTEQNIEEVLGKLPGFRVDKKGAITVNGQAIKKIMIEGDDLTGSNYTVLTKNIRGSVLKKVQVLENHTDNPVMKDHAFSDDLVLNLKLTKETKHILAGSFNIGTGWGPNLKNDLRSNVFSIAKKSKTILAANSNNVGFQAVGDISYRYNSLHHSTDLEEAALVYKGKIPAETLPSSALPNQYMDDDPSTLLFLGNVLTINKKIKVKISGTFHQEKNNILTFDNTRYTGIEAPFELDQSALIKEERHKVDISLSTVYLENNNQFSAKLFTKLVADKLNIINAVDQFNTQNNIPINTQTIHERSPFSFFTGIELTKKVSPNAVGQTVITYATVKGTDNYKAQFQPNFNYIENQPFHALNQVLGIENQKISISQSYLLNFKRGWNVQLFADFDLNTNNLEQEVALVNDTSAIENTFIIPFYRKLKWKTYSVFSLLNKNLDNGTLTFGYNHQLYQFNPLKNQNLDKRYGLDKCFVRLKITTENKGKFHSSFSFAQKILDPNLFYNGKIFKKFNNLETGFNQLSIAAQLDLTLRFSKKDISKGYFFNAFLNFNRSLDAISTNTTVSPNHTATNYFLSAPTFSTYGGGQLEQVLYQLKAHISFSSSFNFSKYQYSIEQDLVNLKTQNYNFEIGYGMDIARKFFVSAYQEIALNKIRQDNLNNNYENYVSKIDIKYKLIKNLILIFQGKRIKSTSDFAMVTNFTLDGSIRLKFDKNRKGNTITFNGVNLLNTKLYENSFVDSFYSNRNGYYLVPRHFTVNWERLF